MSDNQDCDCPPELEDPARDFKGDGWHCENCGGELAELLCKPLPCVDCGTPCQVGGDVERVWCKGCSGELKGAEE